MPTLPPPPHDRARLPRPQGPGTAGHADRVHGAHGRAAGSLLRRAAGGRQPGADHLRTAIHRPRHAGHHDRARRGRGARRAHRAGGGGHAFRQLRSQSRAGLRVGLPRAEGNRRGRHQAGRRRGHGRHGRLPVGARHPRDGTCGPDAAGGEHPGRLRRARTRPCRAGQDRGRRRSHRRRRRLRGGGRGRGGTAGGIDRRQPVLPRDRHRRVRVMRRTGAGGRRHAGHVRAHRPFREALRHTVRTHPARRGPIPRK